MQPGDLLSGRFRIESVLGTGGMGTVYLARHTFLGDRRLAIKAMKRPQHLELFESEARILASLDHAGIVHVHDFFAEGDQHYLVMDHIDGSTLQELVPPPPVFLQEETVLAWAEQVCEALTYLHQQVPPVVLRDLKPSNIMLDRTHRIRLIDFGIACTASEEDDWGAVGSAGYASPEQHAGVTDPRSDLYSLGATLYFLLTAQLPPVALSRLTNDTLKPPTDFNVKISTRIESAILRLLALDPGDRPGTARDAQAELRQAQVHDVQFVQPALVGRHAEIDTLDHWLDMQGDISLALVRGPAGAGRSRLLRHWADRLPNRVTLLVADTASPAMMPYGPILPALQQVLDRVPPGALPHLRGLVAGQSDGTSPAALDSTPTAAKISLYEEIRRALTQVAPLVLLIDDLEQCEAETRALLLYLLEDPRGVPGMRVLASVSNDAADLEPWLLEATRVRPSVELPLRDLSETAVNLLVESAFGGTSLPASVLEAIHDRAGGRPQAVLDILRTWLSDGTLAETEGAWRWDPVRYEAWQAAASDTAVDSRRVWPLLGDDAREVLKHALVGHCSIAREVFAPLLGWDPDRLERALQALRLLHIVREQVRDKSIRFEVVARQMFQEHVSNDNRRHIKLKWIHMLAETIESKPDAPTEDLFRLVSLCDDTDDWSPAASILLRAAERACAMYGYGLAWQLYRKACEASRKNQSDFLRVSMRTAEVGNLAGEYLAVIGQVSEILQQDVGTQRVGFLRLLARTWYNQGNAPRALQVWIEALAAMGVPSAPGALQAVTAMLRALLLPTGRLLEPEGRIEPLLETCHGIIHANVFTSDTTKQNLTLYIMSLVIQIGRASQRPDLQAQSNILLAYFHLTWPRPPWRQARRYVDKSYECLLRDQGQPRVIPMLRDLAYASTLCGLARRAVRLTDEGLRVAEQSSDLNGRVWNLQVGAFARWWEGRLGESATCLEEARIGAHGLRHARLGVMTRQDQGHVFTWLGRFEEAEQCFTTPAPYEMATEFDDMAGEVYQGWLNVRRGQADVARRLLLRAIERIRRARCGALWLVYAVHGLAIVSRPEGVRLAADLRRLGRLPVLLEVHRLSVAAELADLPEARRLYDRVRTLSEDRGLARDLAWTLQRRALLERRSSDDTWVARMHEAAVAWRTTGATTQAERLERVAAAPATASLPTPL